MPLVNVKDLLFDAMKEKYAVGAFNCNNMEILQAIVLAAEEEDSPVISKPVKGQLNMPVLIILHPWDVWRRKMPLCPWHCIWITEQALTR